MGADAQIVELSRALETNGDAYAIHYASEGFHDARDHLPAISAVSVSRIAGGDDASFSVLDAHADEQPEAAALERFFDWLRARPDSLIVHWKMDKAEYGLAALSGRLYHLTGSNAAPQHAQERLCSLDDFIVHRHGEDYAPHPRLPSLLALNGIVSRYSRSPAELVDLYRAGDHGALRIYSTERARQLGTLTRLFVSGELQSLRQGPGVRLGGVVIGSIDVVLHLGERLPSVGAELAHRHDHRAGWTLDDEYDHQDLFRGLLRLHFEDVRAEEWSPSYAGGSSRIDFVLPEVGLAIELKSTRTGLDDRKLGEELIIDAARYESHPKARRLVCLVFDRERRLRNPKGLERDLSKIVGNVPVTVRVVA